MHYTMIVAAAIAAGIAAPVHAGLGLQDFLITDANDMLYMVNGDTLETTFLREMTSPGSVNEIEYIGNNTILANRTGLIVSHNLATGAEQIIFRASDYYTDTSINYTMGLALRDQGNVYFTIQSLLMDSTRVVSGSLDPFDGSYEELNPVDQIAGLYFDSHELSNGDIISADFSDQRIWRQSSVTGETLEVYEVGYGVVSFIELSGQIYTMTKQGDFYSFDADTGLSEFVGVITGAGDSLIGATIPTPSGIALFGFAGALCIRRRR